MSEEKLLKVLTTIVKAWESLPEGFHTSEQVEAWLAKRMKPAIDLARDAAYLVINDDRSYVQVLEDVIDAIQAEIDGIQEVCDHKGHTRVPKANTGNYDPSVDSYWYDCHCDRCNKIWTEPQ